MLGTTTKTRLGAIITGLFMLGVSTTANATLIGDMITCNGISYTCDVGSNTVGAGPEFAIDFNGFPRFNVDVDASSISIIAVTNVITGTIFEITIGDLDWVGMSGEIVGITNFSSNAVGITLSDITVNPHSIDIDLNDAEWDLAAVTSFDLVTRHIPEPGTLALFGLGLAGLGFARRRKAA